MKFKQLINKAGRAIKKNSPAILTGLGVVGLGATAYLAYKSRGKVEEVVEQIEETRESGEEVNKIEVAKDIAEAIYLPVTVGIASVGCILWSYRIQNNRIAILASSLAAQRAHNIYFENRYKKLHGEEEYAKFISPTDEVEHTEVGKNGKEKTTVEQVKKDIDRTIGQWYDQSTEYASDDHVYNVQFINSVNERMQLLLFQRGSLMLNEVREALGFERIRAGALLGWTAGDNFDIEQHISNLGDESKGELKQQIWVSWTRPRYVYEEVEFNGRYSVY